MTARELRRMLKGMGDITVMIQALPSVHVGGHYHPVHYATLAAVELAPGAVDGAGYVKSAGLAPNFRAFLISVTP